MITESPKSAEHAENENKVRQSITFWQGILVGQALDGERNHLQQILDETMAGRPSVALSLLEEFNDGVKGPDTDGWKESYTKLKETLEKLS